MGLTLGDPLVDDNIYYLCLQYGLPIILLIIRIIGLLTCFNFDTTKFYILEGNEKNAKYVLKKIYTEENIEE